jgi:hypothetical protein
MSRLSHYFAYLNNDPYLDWKFLDITKEEIKDIPELPIQTIEEQEQLTLF